MAVRTQCSAVAVGTCSLTAARNESIGFAAMPCFHSCSASIQMHCGVQADRKSHVEDRLEVLTKISGGFTD